MNPSPAELETPEGLNTPVASVKKRRRWGAQDLSLIAVFAALLVVVAVVPPIQIGNLLSVPLTLQTLVVTLSALLLGVSRSFAAVGLYVLLGLVGLPIFAGFRGGIGLLAGPTAGYIIAFPLMALAVGALATLIVRRAWRLAPLLFVLAGIIGLLISHLLGIIGMMINGKLPLDKAIAADVIFVPGDLVKIVLATVLALALHRAFPRLLRDR
ncbi:biotin transporter BioY [Psychromicrobium lacuslunae]|uniref:biotin transporter BioY n=1 Tax=Psychromicrobium lacuslunae TaxID=1618207 RepID=UPI0006972504|nr:biotin transporter BioY [Psychromicrobium lacuslunae]